jgi:DNA-binding transcriptional LysR family regulator
VDLKIAYDAFLPVARWGPLFHLFVLEHPGVRVAWDAVGFPSSARSLLDGSDVGVFLQPPHESGLAAVTIDVSRMFVGMSVGHRLASHDDLAVADVLGEPFPDGPDLHPEYRAFWTLDEHRGGPPAFAGDGVQDAQQGLDAVAAGRAIVTVPAWVAHGLPHPGVITMPLRDGPPVATKLVWREADERPIVRDLVDLTRALAQASDGSSDSQSVRAPDADHVTGKNDSSIDGSSRRR